MNLSAAGQLLVYRAPKRRHSLDLALKAWTVTETRAVKPLLGLLQQASQHQTIVLLDLASPSRGTLDLCRKVRAAHPGTPLVVALDSFTRPQHRIDLLDAGAGLLLPKPMTPEELARHLDVQAPRVRQTPAPSGPLSAPMAESNLTLDLTLEGADAAPWSYNSITGEVDWTARGYRQLGYNPGETSPSLDAFAARTHPDDLEILLQQRAEERAAPPGSKFKVQFRLKLPDGTIRWIERRSMTGPDKPGGRNIYGIDLDITERRLIEERLHAQQGLFNTVLESTPDLVWAKDREGRSTLANRATLALFRELGTDAPSGRRTDEIFRDPVLAARMTADDLRIMERGEAETIEESFDVGGRTVSFQTVKAPLRDCKGGVLGVVGVSRDVTKQRETERRLDEQKSLLEAIGASSPDLIFAKDKNFRLIYANPATLTYLGKTAEETLGHASEELTPHPEEGARHSANDRHVIETGQVAVFDEIVNFPDGRSVIYRSTKAPLRDAAGEIIGTVGISVDMTETRAMEAAIKESEARFRTISEALPGIVFVHTPDGRNSYVNQAFCQFAGRDAENLLDLRYMDIIHQDDLAQSWPRWEQARDGLLPFETEFRLRRHDGAWRWHLLRSVPVRNDDKGEPQWIGTATDITDHKDIETRLRENEERLAAALRAGRLGVFDFDPVTRQLKWDNMLREIWGIDADAAVSEAMFEDGIHPADRAAVTSAIAAAFESGGSGKYSADYRAINRITGDVRWVHAEGDVFFKDGKAVRFVGTVQDIAERKQAEEHIRHLMREVNHRSKNMLAVVQAIANQTAQKSDPRTFARRFAERLQGLAASHDLLVNNAWQGVALSEIVGSQLSHFRDLVRRRIFFDGPDVKLVPSAAQALGMALHELATNAGKYGALSSEDGAVSIDWSVDLAQAPHQFRMRWAERGGPPVQMPAQKGFGTRLLVEMTQVGLQGQVKLDYNPQGIEWEVLAPADLVLEGKDDGTSTTAAEAVPIQPYG